MKKGRNTDFSNITAARHNLIPNCYGFPKSPKPIAQVQEFHHQ